jgi:hypothetical protein
MRGAERIERRLIHLLRQRWRIAAFYGRYQRAFIPHIQLPIDTDRPGDRKEAATTHRREPTDT